MDSFRPLGGLREVICITDYYHSYIEILTGWFKFFPGTLPNKAHGQVKGHGICNCIMLGRNEIV